MIILTEAEKARALEYHSEGWDNCQITHCILSERGDAIYFDMRREVELTIRAENIRLRGLPL